MLLGSACDSYPTSEHCLTNGDPNCVDNAAGTGGTNMADSGSGGGINNPTCKYPQVECDPGTCTNVLTDLDNCGDCHFTCGDDASCVSGKCVADCIASPEVCDGVDNNCDGQIDEEFNLQTDCLVGIGACQRLGLLICDGSGGVKCSATPGAPGTESCDGTDNDCDSIADNGLNCEFIPTSEVCDGVDNDLDGIVDNGFPIGAPCTVGIGSCTRVGIYICDGTGGLKCSASPGSPGTEVCNGIDDNCSGSADEGLSCSCSPTPEVCDGIDNNCNGAVDEGCPIGDQCVVGIGACQRVGLYVIDGSGGVKCSATPGAPGTEVCDGIDNDCNGTADNGLSCGFIPQPELCDGVDNDLDGVVDNGFGIGSTCLVGTGACQRLGLVVCNGPASTTCSAIPGLPSTEVCNGIDDNCNGSADEGLSCSCVPKPEICDGIDNDCNGSVDELFPISTVCQVGIGACQRFGVIICKMDGSAGCTTNPGTPGVETCNGIDDDCDGLVDNGLSCPVCAPSTEVCNGIDDNCNSTVDEGFPVGAQCTVGIGACARTGFYICDPLTGGVKCTATAGTPGTEVCNGIDDNCNGSADEGLSCGLISQPEICDGIDNNLNGIVDEGFGVGSGCAVGVGACQRYGVYMCNGIGGVQCSAVAGAPKSETCNGIDDNCDGSADEGLACTCNPTTEVCDGVDNNCNGTVDDGFPVGTTCMVGVGACQRTGLLVCDGLGGIKCSVNPGVGSMEVCDGIDNNCNGTADEGLSCSCSAVTEVCDGVDNDCDSSVDEGFPVGETCSVGVGACQRLGIFVCNSSGGVKCSTTAGLAKAEICNGIDDNCDGSIDNGISCPLCVPSAEICDGVDNDCDGKVDEGFPLGSTCSVGVGSCARTGIIICNGVGSTACSAIPGSPGTEICNGVDDDCNGVADNGLSCQCSPSAEVCDGIDNNCNSSVDEGFGVGTPCNVGVGACKRFGINICNGLGGVKCSAMAGSPKTETCNGVDDDCNSIVDNGLSCTCNPTPEVCNGIDDNCNGTADEGFSVGTTCTIGIGACKRTGFIICNGLGGTTCSASPGSAGLEICSDGIDNDCDGTIDEPPPACLP